MKGKFTITIKSIIAFMVLFVLLVSSTSPIFAATEENTISETEKKHSSFADIEIEKYVNYNYDEQKGVLLQLGVKTGIDFKSEEDYLPIVASSVLTHAPQIEGKYPNSAVLFKYDTKATNGNNNSIIPVFEYDKTKGEARITTSNGLGTDGKMYSEYLEGARDYYSIIFNYDQNCYSKDNEIRQLKYRVDLENLVPGKTKNLSYTKYQEYEKPVSQNIGNVITTNISTDEIYNGFIKSNKQNETDYATNYTENTEVEILKADIGEETAIKLETLVNKDNEEKQAEGIVYKSIELNKQNVLDVLGDNGYLKIVDEEGNVLGELNKDTQVDENGAYKVDYGKDLSKLKIIISKPQKIGKIDIKNNKQILNTFNAEINKIQEVSNITATRKIENKIENEITKDTKTEIIEKEVYTNTNKQEIEILNAKTEVNFSIDNKNWTNKNQNDININLELLVNDSKYNLFKDPSFEIQLPNEVKNAIVAEKDIQLSNGNGLKVASTNFDENTKKINVVLEGTQKEYIEKAFGNGTNITIPVTIILNNNIENTERDIVLSFVNKATDETGNIIEKAKLENFNLPQEENKEEEKTEPTLEENKPTEEQKIEQPEEVKEENITAEGIKVTVSAQREGATDGENDVFEGEFIKYNLKVENTTEETLKNVSVKAVIPEELIFAQFQNNYDKVDTESDYIYKENVKTTSKNIEQLEPNKAKYLSFEVRASDLPEGITEKEVTTKIYGYIDNKLAEKEEITHKIQKAEYSISASAMRRGSGLFIIGLNIEDKQDKGEKVKLKWNISEEFKHFELHFPEGKNGSGPNIIDTNGANEFELKPGKYYLSVSYKDDQVRLENKDFKDLFSNFEVNDKYKSNELLTRYYYRSFSIEQDSETQNKNSNELKYDEEFSYKIKITNTSKVDFSKINVFEGKETNHIVLSLRDYLPTEIEPISIEYNNYVYDENSDSYAKQHTKETMSLLYDENDIQKPNVDIDLTIPYGESIDVNVKAKAGLVEKKTTINNVAFLYDRANATNLAESNGITNIILPYDYKEEQEEPVEPEEPRRQITPTEPENPNKPTEPTIQPLEPGNATDNSGKKANVEENTENTENTESKKYTISGLAWLDSNEDGKKQASEETLSGIDALLVDKSNNVVGTARTTNGGKYTFENIEEGKYIVVFKFNTTKYRLTAYHKASVGETENSDAIDTERTINGTMTRCGVTEQLELNNDLSNIDIGLIENKTFNFKVDKYVSKVSVKTASGTKENVYNNSKLAKTEIRAKEIEGATVLVEYKIVVTNNGEMPGKVGTVVDTLPQGLDFSSELNTSWAKNTDGTIVNNSLAGRVIEPGKSVELSLLATKTMKEDSTGTFTNTVKITNISNEAKLQEKDVKDNTSSAELIISVSTGGVVYILSGIIGLGILIGIAILIKKNRNMNKTIKNMGLMVLAIGLIFATPINSIAISNGDTLTFYWQDGPTQYTNNAGGYNWSCNERGENGTTDGYVQTKTISVSSPTKELIGKDEPAEARNWTLRKTNAGRIIMHEVGDSIVVGPLGIENVGGYNCSNFVFTVNGTQYSTVCDSQGNGGRSTNQSGTYYLKIPMTNRVGYISVDAEIRYNVTYRYKITRTLTAKGGQQMTATDVSYETETKQEKKTAHLDWVVDTCNLKILKTDEFGVDEEGNRLDLSGIHFIINCGSEGDKFLETDQNGKTKSLEGLNPGTYTVYEIISGGDGSKDLPERLRNYYKANTTYGGYNVKTIGTASISAGEIYTYNALNLRDYTGLLLSKIDASKEHNLEGIKFKIKDKETGKWVQWQRDNKGQYVVVGVTDKYDINDEFTTLTTNQEGLTEKVKRFEVGKKYEIYEVDIGDYKYLYEVGPRNGGTEEGLLVATWTPVARKEGYSEGTIKNKQYYGAFKIVKKMANTKASLAGIGFKIRVRKSENDNEWKWLKLKVNEDKELVVANEFVDYKDATVIYTNKDGETQDIIKAPIFVEAGKEDKYIYDAYEVYIPGMDETTKLYKYIEDATTENNEGVIEEVEDNDALRDLYGNNTLRDVLTLDQKEYKKLYNIIDNEELVKTMDSIATFTLEKEIQANNKHRAIITFPSNSDDNDAVYNNQSYIKIRGNVWQEILEGKDTIKEANNIKDENDYNIQGIEVELVDSQGNVVQKTKRFGGQDEGPQSTLTDENGNYLFEYVILGTGKNDKIGLLKEGYRIRFTYDGVTYESIIPYAQEDVAGKPNPVTSKAAEEFKSADNRKDFNNKWQEINGDTSIDDVKLEYYELQDETNPLIKKVDLKYRDIIYHKDIKGNLVTVTGDPKFLIESYTEQGKLQKYYDVLAKEKLAAEASEEEDKILWSIDNINLGVYYRERPNLTLQKDEFMAHATVNGKEYTYVYNSKLGEELNDTGLQEVKFDSNIRRSLPIYEADVKYGTADGQNGEKLKASITYKIKLQNASTNLNTSVNSIREFYSAKANGKEYLELNKDKIYLVENAKEFDKDIVGNVQDFESKVRRLEVEKDFTAASSLDNDSKFVETSIDFINPIKLGPANNQENDEPSTKYVFLTFNIKDIQEYFYELGLANATIPNSEIENYAEIASYSVYADNKFEDRYAGVDSTSIPGNLDVSSKDAYNKTKEDDSDKALGLRLVKAAQRTIGGIVFEDAPVKTFNGRTIDGNDKVTDGTATFDLEKKDDNQVSPGEERIGNGIYDNSEEAKNNNMLKDDGTKYEDIPIANVKVRLLDMDNNGESAKVWKPAENPTKENPGEWVTVDSLEIKTAEDGTYTIPGLPTGSFKMQFEWGKTAGDRDVRDYKCTVYTNPYAENKTGETISIKDDWVYKEVEEPRYSDAIDDYTTRKAIDKIDLGVEGYDTIVDNRINEIAGKLGVSLTDLGKDENISRVTMLSESPKFTIGVEKEVGEDVTKGSYEDKDNKLNIDVKESIEGQNPYLEFNLTKLDFGIIERARQAIGVSKHVRELNIKTADKKPVVIAYFDNDGKLQTIAGEKYVTGGYELQYLWAQIDKEIEHDMDLEIEYDISVKNYSEIDYDYNEYYLFGNIKPEKIVKLSAENLHDYVSGSALSSEDDRWEIVKPEDYTANPENCPSETEKLYEELYQKAVAEGATNIAEYMANKIDEFKYPERAKTNTKKLFEEFSIDIETEKAATNADEFRARKITGRQILKGVDTDGKNKLVANPYLPGEKHSETLKTSKKLGTGEDARFYNDVEITKVKLGDGITTGRRHSIQIAPLYDVAESVTVTPATGEDKDFTGIIIATIGCLTVLASGIILIKRYVGKSK